MLTAVELSPFLFLLSVATERTERGSTYLVPVFLLNYEPVMGPLL